MVLICLFNLYDLSYGLSLLLVLYRVRQIFLLVHWFCHFSLVISLRISWIVLNDISLSDCGLLCTCLTRLSVPLVCSTMTWYPLQHIPYSLNGLSASFIINSVSPSCNLVPNCRRLLGIHTIRS